MKRDWETTLNSSPLWVLGLNSTRMWHPYASQLPLVWASGFFTFWIMTFIICNVLYTIAKIYHELHVHCHVFIYINLPVSEVKGSALHMTEVSRVCATQEAWLNVSLLHFHTSFQRLLHTLSHTHTHSIQPLVSLSITGGRPKLNSFHLSLPHSL